LTFSVRIESLEKTLDYTINLQNKITVICGDSGVGKTTLVDFLVDYYRENRLPEGIDRIALLDNDSVALILAAAKRWYEESFSEKEKPIKFKFNKSEFEKLYNILLDRFLQKDLSECNDYELDELARSCYNSREFSESFDVLREKIKLLKQKEEVAILKEYLCTDRYGERVLYVSDDQELGGPIVATLLDNSKSYYYLLVNRLPFKGVSYGVESIFTLENKGNSYNLKPYYNDWYNPDYSGSDVVIVEGEGSDLKFFETMCKNTDVKVFCPKYNNRGGKYSLRKYINENKESLKCYNKIAVMLDMSASGSIMQEIDEIHNLVFNSNYHSFEYMLLKSNFFNDNLDIDELIQNNVPRFKTIERFCTRVIIDETNYKNCFYRYEKKNKGKIDCYCLDCCFRKSDNYVDPKKLCNKYSKFYNKQKIVAMLSGTIFEGLLDIVNSSTKESLGGSSTEQMQYF
jgi:hypothetical protein